MPQESLPLLHLSPDDISRRVLVVGDPARARKAATLLSDSVQVGNNREYVTFTGRFEGQRITVVSHGIGSAGAGLAFEELARGGARVLIRVGTCGAVADGIADGSSIIATGAVRDEGLTPRLIPLGYPALAHHQVITGLVNAAAGIKTSDSSKTADTSKAADSVKTPCRTGVILTSDLFYPSKALGQDWSVWKASRVVAVEMEAATLFVIAALHGLKAGAILTVDGNPTLAVQDMSAYDPHRNVVAEGVEQALRIALHALVKINPE